MDNCRLSYQGASIEVFGDVGNGPLRCADGNHWRNVI